MSNLLTLNTRNIFLPKLDLVLNFNTIELPDKSVENIQDDTIINNRLQTDCINVTGASANSIITYKKWTDISETVLATFKSDRFKTEILNVYAGNSKEKKESLDNWINTSSKYLIDSANKYNSLPLFTDGITRNYLLNPVALSNNSISNKFLDYTGEPSILQSIYWDLREKGFTEIEILNWNKLTKNLSLPIFPTSKEMFDIISNYEIPFAGSPELRQTKMSEFKNYCRGAAFLMLSGSAFKAVSALDNQDWKALAFYIIGGGIAALAFISIGPLANKIESYLDKKSNRNEVK